MIPLTDANWRFTSWLAVTDATSLTRRIWLAIDHGSTAPATPLVAPLALVEIALPLDWPGVGSGKPRIEAGDRMSPRMSMFVSRSGS